VYNMVSNLYRRKLGFVSPGAVYACSQNWEERLLASSCVLARMEQRGSPGTAIHWIWFSRIFRKSVEKNKVKLKYDKNNGKFACTSLFWVMTNLMHSFLMYLFYASTCFEQQVLIIGTSKLY
jgi:hypothetical protein